MSPTPDGPAAPPDGRSRNSTATTAGPRRAWFAPYVASARAFVTRRPVLAGASVAAALVLAGSGLSYAAVDHYTATIDEVPAFEGLTDRPADDAATNILVVGSDDRGGLSTERRLELALGLEDFGRHTDTMLLVHLTSGGAVDVVSIPRDSAVTIAAHESSLGTDVSEYTGKLNSSYSSGGPPLLVQTVETATGVHVDHYVEVNFEGFVNIVNALGGVEVCTDEPIDDELSGLVLPAGTSTVDGDMGLAYVRARYFDPTADYGRMQRQQAFLAAMARKAASASVLLNPFRANSTVNAALSSVSADPALNEKEVKRILRQLRATTPGDVQFHTVPVAEEEYLDDGSLAVVWDADGAARLFDALRNNRSVLSQLKTASEDDGMEQAAATNLPVVVLNGNGTPGIATDAAAGIAAAGHPVASTGNAEQVSRTEIAYPPAAKSQAERLKAMLPKAKLTPTEDVSDVTVTLGTDFEGLENVPESPNSSPAPQPPAAAAEDVGEPEKSVPAEDAPQETAPIAGTGVGTGSGADSLCS